jgi:hypothetical protein
MLRFFTALGHIAVRFRFLATPRSVEPTAG